MTYSNRINISKSKKGKIAWNKGLKNIYTQEMKDNISKKLKGRIPWNKGLKYLICDGKKIMLDKENIETIEYNKKIKIICLDTGEIFDCLKDVSKKFKINYSTLKYNIKKGKNNINGITFQKIGYIENKHSEVTKKYLSDISKIKIKIICVETGEIFDSIKDAAIKLQIGYSALKNNVSGKSKTTNGLTFKKII